MAESTQVNLKQNNFVRKAGRTILVQLLDLSFDCELFKNLEGLQGYHLAEKSNSHFLTFDNLSNSLSAFKELKQTYSNSLRVKFAHYKIFFNLKGLNENSDYSSVKSAHIDYISNNLNGNVLYYKLYRRNNSYLECGDLTLDTKESFDLLVDNENEHKDFELNVDNVKLSGSHFRFNKKRKNEDDTLVN